MGLNKEFIKALHHDQIILKSIMDLAEEMYSVEDKKKILEFVKSSYNDNRRTLFADDLIINEDWREIAPSNIDPEEYML